MNLSVMTRAGLATRVPARLLVANRKAAPVSAHPAHTSAFKSISQPREVCQRNVVTQAAAADAPTDPFESFFERFMGKEAAVKAVTILFILAWYGLNVAFNLSNKSLFNVFPFPWFVSTIHVVVGTVYCALTYLVGFKEASFKRPITRDEFLKILGPAAMHAIGHVAANLSFAAVAISLTHTVKTLEPAFNVILSKLILGTATPLPVVASLVPIMVGVSLASAAELSFNWFGFLTAMGSNLTFGFRAVWSKKAMADIKDLGSTAVYAYTTLISVFICAPGVYIFEGAKLATGIENAIGILGATGFYQQLALVGILYHLYNQFAFNTLARVSPVSHGVCNVVKRIFIIGSSVLFFGNSLTTNTKIGTAIALAGTWLYTEASKKKDH